MKRLPCVPGVKLENMYIYKNKDIYYNEEEMKKKYKIKIVFIVSICFLVSFIYYYNKPSYVIENNYTLEKKDIEKIEKSVNKMGPYYQYIVNPDGTLKVKINNKWLLLKY